MQPRLPFVVRHIGSLLTLILMIKIAGYFSIVEERSVNQVFKIISRLGMTGAVLLVFFALKRMGCVSKFKYDNVLAPFFYILYLLLGFASIAWSTDPMYSALQWSMTFETFVFVLIFMRVVALVNHNFPSHRIDLVKMFAWSIFPIMLVFLIGSFTDPETFYRGMRGGEEQRLGGWIMNPNELGMLSSLGAAMAYMFMESAKRKVWPVLMIIVAIIILALTSSRSSAIGFLLIMGVLVLMSENVRLKIATFAAVGIAVPLLLRFVIFKDSGGVEEVMSMTGRLPFWKALLNEGIVKEPFFGYGFMRINYTDYFQGLNTYPAKMTHNTFIQVLMNLGFVGLFIALWQLILTIRNFFIENKSVYRKFFIAMFIPIFINSITEFGIFGEANFGVLFYQFLIMLFVVKISKQLSSKEQILKKIHVAKWKHLRK